MWRLRLENYVAVAYWEITSQAVQWAREKRDARE
jgi:hypothetical protein